ncbi:MAG: hypothetical protein WKG00_03160 [Polyangiaceae bacterium]
MRTDDDPPPSSVALLATPVADDGPWLFSVGGRHALSLSDAEALGAAAIAARRGAAS